MPATKKPKSVKKTESIRGILLLLEKQSLSPTLEWYVKRLSEVYDEIEPGKSPKVKLEILQELRDLIIPAEESTAQREVHDPAVDGPQVVPQAMHTVAIRGVR